MSTTTSRAVAVGYSEAGSTQMVFEMQQGMINRGAELQWLSAFPGEAEVKQPWNRGAADR